MNVEHKRTDLNWRGLESSARSYAKKFPFVVKGGFGCKLFADDGQEYLDFLSGAGVSLLGHDHPVINSAIRDSSHSVLSTLDLATDSKGRFVEALQSILIDIFGSTMKFHCCGPTGSDAIEAMLKLSMQATGRRGVIAFSGSYHGMSQGALSITSNNRLRKAGLRTGHDVTFCPFPYPYRGIGPYADPKLATEICVANIESLISDDHSGVELPGVIVLECVQGEGGNIVAPKAFIQGLRALCDKYGILLAFDEIQSGVGRTGRWFAFEHYDVLPDLFVVSKGIGGGIPLSLLIYRDELDVWKSGDHIGTFRGQTLAFAAGAALLSHMRETKLISAVAQRGDVLRNGLQQLVDMYDLAAEARGLGLFQAIECRGTQTHSESAVTGLIQNHLLQSGIVVERGGRNDSVLRFLPPLIITEAEIHQLLDGLNQAFEDTTAHV